METEFSNWCDIFPISLGESEFTSVSFDNGDANAHDSELATTKFNPSACFGVLSKFDKSPVQAARAGGNRKKKKSAKPSKESKSLAGPEISKSKQSLPAIVRDEATLEKSNFAQLSRFSDIVGLCPSIVDSYRYTFPSKCIHDVPCMRHADIPGLPRSLKFNTNECSSLVVEKENMEKIINHAHLESGKQDYQRLAPVSKNPFRSSQSNAVQDVCNELLETDSVSHIRGKSSLHDTQLFCAELSSLIGAVTPLLHAQAFQKVVHMVDPYIAKMPQDKEYVPLYFISGLSHFKLVNYNEAESRFMNGDKICLAIGKHGDSALCNLYIGDIKFSSRHYQEASSYYQSATLRYSPDTVAALFRMVPPSLSAIHAKHGSALRNASKMVDAIQEYKLAIKEAKTEKDKLAANTSLGNLYRLLGENSSALTHYEQSVEISEKLHDYISLGWAHGNMGNAYLGLFQKDKALSHLQQSLDLTVKHEPTPQAIGRAYNNLGTAYQSLGDLDKATEMYQLAHDQATYGNDKAGKARVCGNMGNVLMLRKKYEDAVSHYGDVLSLSKDRSTLSTAHHNRGCAYYEWGESELDQQYGDQVGLKSAPENTKSIDGITASTVMKAKYYIHGPGFEDKSEYRPRRVRPIILKYFISGREDLEEVVKFHETHLDNIKGSSKGLTLSVSLFETNSRTFYLLQDCLVNMGKYHRALLVAEQSRARTLGELMLKRKGWCLHDPLSSPMSFEQILTSLGSIENPVLYLSYTGARLVGWVFISKKSGINVNMFEVPLKDDQFDGKSFDYHLRYSLTEALVERSFEMYREVGDYNEEISAPVQTLYNLIAKPLLSILAKYEADKSHKIIVITDSYTALLPFSSLHNSEEDTFLGDSYCFQLMPSILTMSILNQLSDINIVHLPTDAQNMCIVGNPNIPQFKYNDELWNLGKLPHAKREAESVAHIMKTTPILEGQATKSAVLMRLMSSKIIHLATHGSASAGFLAFGMLVPIGQDRAANAQGVLLYPEEVEKLNISPALVVLSSCDSGRGAVKADGIQGMARAFILAGAQAVLTTLWRVPDESAAIFMQFFYQFMMDGLESTKALQKAILSIRCFSKYSQYIHWSGYQLTGRDIYLQYVAPEEVHSLEKMLGKSNVFPRLQDIKQLELGLVEATCHPTDVQIIQGTPGLDAHEIVIDFIHNSYKHFVGGIYWINCDQSEFVTGSMKYIQKSIHLHQEKWQTRANDKAGKARVCGNMGNVLMLRKNDEDAVSHYGDVLSLSKDRSTLSTAHHNRGCAYYEWGESELDQQYGDQVGLKSAPENTKSIDGITASMVMKAKYYIHGPGFEDKSENRPRKVSSRSGSEDLEEFQETHLDNIKGSSKGLTLSISLFETNSHTFHCLQNCLVNLVKYHQVLPVDMRSGAGKILSELGLKWCLQDQFTSCYPQATSGSHTAFLPLGLQDGKEKCVFRGPKLKKSSQKNSDAISLDERGKKENRKSQIDKSDSKVAECTNVIQESKLVCVSSNIYKKQTWKLNVDINNQDNISRQVEAVQTINKPMRKQQPYAELTGFNGSIVTMMLQSHADITGLSCRSRSEKRCSSLLVNCSKNGPNSYRRQVCDENFKGPIQRSSSLNSDGLQSSCSPSQCFSDTSHAVCNVLQCSHGAALHSMMNCKGEPNFSEILAKTLKISAQENELPCITLFFLRALCYFKLGHSNDAKAKFLRCDELCVKFGRTGDSGLCNVYLGDIESISKNFMEASYYYVNGIRKYSTESLSTQFCVLTSSISATHAKHYLALRNASKLVDAIEGYKQAIEGGITEKDKLTYHSCLGNLYQSLGDNSNALAHYEYSVEISQNLGDYTSLGWAHRNMGNTYLGLFQKDEALSHLQQSLNLTVEHEPTPQAIGRAYNNLGTAYQSLGDLDKATEMYKCAINQALCDKAGQTHACKVLQISSDNFKFSTAYSHKGCAYYKSGKSKPSEVQDDLEVNKNHVVQPKFYVHGPNFKDDSSLSPCPVTSDTATYYEQIVNSCIYHRLQDCLVNLKQYTNALQIAEQCRARTLGELMLKRMGQHLHYPLTSPMSPEQIVDSVNTLEYPVLYLSNIRNRLLGWVLVPKHSNVVINMFDVLLKYSQDEESSLNDYIENSLDGFDNIHVYGREDTVGLKNDNPIIILQTLYNIIVKPFLAIFQKFNMKPTKLVIMNDTDSSLIPFASLCDPDTNCFFGDAFQFQFMPSFLAMSILNQLPNTHVVNLPTDDFNMCIVGNPNIPQFKYNGELWKFDELAYSQQEAETVAHITKTSPILKSQATKSAVLQRMMNAKVIHLATHGSASAGFLVFGIETIEPNKAADAQGVLLYPSEVESLNISPSLVVLSSCYSGQDTSNYNGIKNMAQAFLLAGAQAVLTTLWRIPDESAAIFMQFFYQYMTDGLESTKALQKAILSIRCFSKYSQYIHWSGYQLMGRDIMFNMTIPEEECILKKRLGTRSVFPRLEEIKQLKSNLANSTSYPTDIQILQSYGLDANEVVTDFIYTSLKSFTGGMFWINCEQPEFIRDGLDNIEKSIGGPLEALQLSELKQCLVVFDGMMELPQSESLQQFMANRYTHCIILYQDCYCLHDLITTVSQKLLRGCNVYHLEPLSTILSTQRIVYSIQQATHFCPKSKDQVTIERIANTALGSPILVDIAARLLSANFNNPSSDKLNDVGDSWDSITGLLDACQFDSETRLLLYCMSHLGCGPIPVSIVSSLSALITETSGNADLAGSLLTQLMNRGFVKLYPSSVVIHEILNKHIDMEFVYVPKYIGDYILNNLGNLNKIVAYSICNRTLSSMLQQPHESIIIGFLKNVTTLLDYDHAIVGDDCYAESFRLLIKTSCY